MAVSDNEHTWIVMMKAACLVGCGVSSQNDKLSFWILWKWQMNSIGLRVILAKSDLSDRRNIVCSVRRNAQYATNERRLLYWFFSAIFWRIGKLSSAKCSSSRFIYIKLSCYRNPLIPFNRSIFLGIQNELKKSKRTPQRDSTELLFLLRK